MTSRAHWLGVKELMGHPECHPVLGDAAYPTVPYAFSASPAQITSAATALGEHTDLVLDRIDTPRPRRAVKSAQLKPPKDRRGGPLEGVRVVERTKVWAGPYVPGTTPVACSQNQRRPCGICADAVTTHGPAPH